MGNESWWFCMQLNWNATKWILFCLIHWEEEIICLSERLVSDEVIINQILKVCRIIYWDVVAIGTIELHIKQGQYSCYCQMLVDE